MQSSKAFSLFALTLGLHACLPQVETGGSPDGGQERDGGSDAAGKDARMRDGSTGDVAVTPDGDGGAPDQGLPDADAGMGACPRDGQWPGTWRRRIRFPLSSPSSPVGASASNVIVPLRLNAGPEGPTDLTPVAVYYGADPLEHFAWEFDPLGNPAVIWVRVPSISFSEPQDLVVYFDGTMPDGGTADPLAVFGDYAAVYHFGDFSEVTGRTGALSEVGEMKADGVAGGAYLPDELGAGVAIATPAVTDHVRVEAWLKPAVQSPSGAFEIGGCPGASGGLGLEWDADGEWTAAGYPGEEGVCMAARVQAPGLPDGWNHVVVHLNRVAMWVAIYVDGRKLSGSAPQLQVLENASLSLKVGSVEGLQVFDGLIDELRVAFRIPDDSRIFAEYYYGAPGSVVAGPVECKPST